MLLNYCSSFISKLSNSTYRYLTLNSVLNLVDDISFIRFVFRDFVVLYKAAARIQIEIITWLDTLVHLLENLFCSVFTSLGNQLNSRVRLNLHLRSTDLCEISDGVL